MCLAVTMVTVVVPPTDSSSFSTVDHVTTTRYVCLFPWQQQTQLVEYNIKTLASKGRRLKFHFHFEENQLSDNISFRPYSLHTILETIQEQN